MSTPLFEAVQDYLAHGRARFHMPGHKGKLSGFLREAAQYDITEVDGADSLYEASGAIAECEKRYAQVYGTAATLLCAGGSTLCIQTMLALAVPPGSTILAGRGVHTAAIHAMALLDLHPKWAYSTADPVTGLLAPPDAQTIQSMLEQYPHAAAVYITSPTYLGAMSDIQGIASVCHKHGIPLLVDNAHGAHLRFLPDNLHPIHLGADMCCDSLHKTLPVLTGGAALHVANPKYVPMAKQRMSVFGSTSPSYLILLSVDQALSYLEKDVHNDLNRLLQKLEPLKKQAVQAGFGLLAEKGDPVRLSVDFITAGYTSETFSEHLHTHGIEPEYLGNRFCVFLPTGLNTESDWNRLRAALVPSVHPMVISPTPHYSFHPQSVCSLRKAVFSSFVTLPVEQAQGKIAAAAVAPCPPGIPILLPGEKLDANAVMALKSYGIFHVNVLE